MLAIICNKCKYQKECQFTTQKIPDHLFFEVRKKCDEMFDVEI